MTTKTEDSSAAKTSREPVVIDEHIVEIVSDSGEGAQKCGGCGLAKGSPGCCKIDPDSDDPVALCVGCGHIKGTDKCCDKDAAKCSKCQLAMGSPGCCVIK